jgi:hypothetical protein
MGVARRIRIFLDRWNLPIPSPGPRPQTRSSPTPIPEIPTATISASAHGSAYPNRAPSSGAGSLRVSESDAGVESLGDPLMEYADVVLAGRQHPAHGVRPGVGRELAPLAGIEVLLVDPVEQLDRAA